jgi:hypothetical protein
MAQLAQRSESILIFIELLQSQALRFEAAAETRHSSRDSGRADVTR